MLEITDNIYAGMPIPDKINHQTILDVNKKGGLDAQTYPQDKLDY